ncbi:MAG: hypothetical protein ABIP51_00720 [Bacteroidia bacterium]
MKTTFLKLKLPIIALLMLFTFQSKAQYFEGGFPIGYGSGNKEFDKVGGTLFLSSLNLTVNTFNTVNFNNKKKKSNAGFGIITGLVQFSYGVMNSNTEPDLSAVDISLGAATIVYSSIRLFKKERKNHEEKLSLTPYFFKSPLIGKLNGISLKLKF